MNKVFPRFCFAALILILYTVSSFAWVPPVDEDATVPKKRWAIEAHQNEIEDFEDASDVRWTTKDSKVKETRVKFDNTKSKQQEKSKEKQTSTPTANQDLIVVQTQVADDPVPNSSTSETKAHPFLEKIKGFFTSIFQ